MFRSASQRNDDRPSNHRPRLRQHAGGCRHIARPRPLPSVRSAERGLAAVGDHVTHRRLALGLLIHWFRVPKEWPVSPMISWIGAVVLMSAAIVPNSPMKTLVAGLIA